MLLTKYFYRLSFKSTTYSFLLSHSSWAGRILPHSVYSRLSDLKTFKVIVQNAERPKSRRACYTREMSGRFLFGPGIAPLVFSVIPLRTSWLTLIIYLHYRLETVRPPTLSRLPPYNDCARSPVWNTPCMPQEPRLVSTLSTFPDIVGILTYGNFLSFDRGSMGSSKSNHRLCSLSGPSTRNGKNTVGC